MSQSNHFVQNTTERPNVRLLIIWLLLTNFRREIIRSSNGSLCAIISMLKNSCNTKVSNFDRPILVHEDVLSFEISVKDFPIVNVLNGKSHLDKPIKNLVFRVTDFSNFLLICNFGVEISSVGIVHDNAKTPLVHKRLFVGNDVRMPHCFQDMNFVDGIFTLLPVHFRHINNFHDVSLSVLDRLHKYREPK